LGCSPPVTMHTYAKPVSSMLRRVAPHAAVA
jgi:hypothetical protein